MDVRQASACGILFCYNEEHIIAETLSFYLSQGIDLVIFDNNSNDKTPQIIKSFQEQVGSFPGKIIDVVGIETEGYEWIKILRSGCEYMHAKLNHYEWILVIDADSFYSSAVKEMSLLEFMGAVKKSGYNVIDGRVYEFYPTQQDDPKIASALERLKYCRPMDEGIYFAIKYHKIFLYHPSLDFYTHGGHIVLRENPRVYTKLKFIFKHYPWVSYEHGLKKIFQDRKPRYVERKDSPTTHWQWMGMLPIKKDLVKDYRKLILYDQNAVLMPGQRFLRLMQVPLARFFWGIRRWLKYCFQAAAFLRYLMRAFAFGSLRNTLRLFMRQITKEIGWMIRMKELSINKGIGGLVSVFKRKILAYKAILQQEPCAFAFPGVYHFLMTNYCNARCIFCNQVSGCDPKKEITLDKFKLMAEHIPVQEAKVFNFSGGGEPLLCGDLFEIIKFVNANFPWVDVNIRTNGLLIGKFAEELAGLNIARLEISLHGSPEINDAIIQRNNSDDIFQGLKLLNSYLTRSKKKIYKAFYPSVSKININDIPWLVSKAAELKVGRVSINFCRYFPDSLNGQNSKLNRQDSLFYHPGLYNKVIRESKRLAMRLGVDFDHEPLFAHPFKEKPCLLPWLVVLVDWEGDVYPCNGGEVWFNDKVKKGQYNFGNLLQEYLYQFWNNDTFVMIRRTCNINSGETFIPECLNCHNSLCLKGPDSENRHILKNLA